MSPRAACRLETLGFEQVHDYLPGKVDWLAGGLPTEGEGTREARAGEHARGDVATCRPADRVETVQAGVEASPYTFALVTTEEGIVLGRLGAEALQGDAGATAGEAMTPGPSTVRAHEPLDGLLERLRSRALHTMVVTTPEGRLLGVVSRDSPAG